MEVMMKSGSARFWRLRRKQPQIGSTERASSIESRV